MKDAIIGLAKGYKWAQLQLYAITLANCGFKGEKILFTNDLDAEVIENLMKLGFRLIPFELPEELRGQDCSPYKSPENWMKFNRFRYLPAIEFLKKNQYRNVLWCDVRDLYFQTDPAEWMKENIRAPYRRLIGAAEGWLIRDEPHNAAWCKAVSLQDYNTWLKDEEVICAGTIGGDHEIVLYAFEALYELIGAIQDIRAGEQGIYNYLIRKDKKIKDCLFIPKNREAFVVTGWPNKSYEKAGWSTDDAPRWNGEDMCVYSPETNEPVCIVHQYDRDPVWEQSMQWVLSRIPQ